MEKGISPEERLLRLIKKGTKPQGLTEKKDEGISAEKQKARLVTKEQKRESIKVISRFLLLFLLLLGGYFLFELITSRPADILVEIPGALEEVPEAEPVTLLQPFEFYTKEIGRRELFTSLIPKEEGKPEPVVTLKDLTANLSLIGIIESDSRLQAIVEDRKQQKTYFLYKGDSIGEIKIKDILEGKVILGYGEEELELVL